MTCEDWEFFVVGHLAGLKVIPRINCAATVCHIWWMYSTVVFILPFTGIAGRTVAPIASGAPGCGENTRSRQSIRASRPGEYFSHRIGQHTGYRSRAATKSRASLGARSNNVFECILRNRWNMDSLVDRIGNTTREGLLLDAASQRALGAGSAAFAGTLAGIAAEGGNESAPDLDRISGSGSTGGPGIGASGNCDSAGARTEHVAGRL